MVKYIKSVLPKAAQHEKVKWFARPQSSKGNKIINKSVLPKAAQHWSKKGHKWSRDLSKATLQNKIINKSVLPKVAQQ
jgi:hypothetical protein